MTTQENVAALGSYIDALYKLPPSEYPDHDLLSLEQLLNELYVVQLEHGCSEDIEKALIEALALASYLVSCAKHAPDQPRSVDFFKTMKNLPRLLKVIKYYLEQPETG